MPRSESPLWTGLAPFVALGLALNAFVWDRAFGFRPYLYDQQRLIQLVGLAVGTALAIRYGASALRSWLTLPRQARIGLFAITFIGVTSSAASTFPRAAFREVGLFVVLAVTALVVADARRTHGRAFDRAALLVVFASATTYVVAFFAMDALFALRLIGTRENQMWGFDNPRLFGQVGYWVFPLLVTMVMESSGHRRTRWLAGAVGVFWGVLVIESGSRAALYAIGVGLVAVFLFGRGAARSWSRTALLILAVSVGAWVVIYGSLAGHSGLFRIMSAGAGDSGRFALWATALELARTHPLLGIGPEHYAHTHGTAFGSPHNVPLQLLAEWGGPAAIIALSLAAWGLWSWLTKVLRPAARKEVSANPLLMGLTAALVSTGFASMFEGTINTPLGQLFVATTTGWMIGVHAEHRARLLRPQIDKWAAAALAVSAFTAFGALAYGAVPYAIDPVEHAGKFTDANPGERFSPRFWIVGRTIP